MTTTKTMASGQEGSPPQERQNYLDTPAFWDYQFGGPSEPRLSLGFEGDPYAWEQLKEKAVEQGVDPQELLRFALYQYLEGPGKSAAARARFMAHREWERTRPVLVCDEKGARWIPADGLEFLADA